MVEAVVSVLVERVFILLQEELTFLGGVHGKISDLQTQLKFMQGFLEDASKKQDANKDVRICVSEIRELAYDAEDVLESFFVDIIEPRQQDGFSHTLKKYASIPIDAIKLHKLGNKIEEINGNITALTLNLQNYSVIYKDVTPGSTSTSSTPEKIDLRKTYDYTDEEYTIGLDEDVPILLEKLIDQSKRHQVISICGMGGLGKSTLAKKLFKHKHVTNHFNHFAWVFVSQQFQMRRILQDILIKLKSKSEEERISKMNDEDIARELYKLQKAEKCLVVIDDLWEKEDWDVLKHAFPNTNKGTIVLTTRNKTLGLYVGSESFIHEPRTLTDDESWKLFQMKAFPIKDHPYPPEMKMLGEKMVKKCSGLPLAIIVLGGVLATKSSLHEWNLALESFGMYLRSGETSDYSTIHGVLALSYSELPYHLKPCFLSLSQFPEDSLLSTRTLFQMWMAESIVTNQSYEKAQGYLQELIDRCLVQIGEIGSFGRIKSCRLHDLVRDLTLSLSKANKENFLEIIDGKTHTVLANPQISQARRVLVGQENQNQNFDDLICLQKNSRLRTLIGQNCELEASSVGNFKMLRTLRLINCKIGSIKEIGKLIHLKYLYIWGGSSINHLPSSLGNLRYLQTFIFCTNSKTLKISKKIFINFQELRYIYIYCGCHRVNEVVELNVGELKNLQTLVAPQIRTKFLKKLSNLKHLALNLSDLKSVSKVLNGLTTLNLEIEKEFSTGDVEEILLGCPQLHKLRLFGKIEKLPIYNEDFTPKLTQLTLEYSRLSEDPMPLLEKFPNLTFLQLVHTSGLIEMVCSSKGFPRLKTLKLKYLFGVFDWQVKEGSMPNLSHLFIENCSNLKMDGIKFLKNLSHFEIDNVPQEFTDRVKEEGEDYHKIRHVPSILIKNEYSS